MQDERAGGVELWFVLYRMEEQVDMNCGLYIQDGGAGGVELWFVEDGGAGGVELWFVQDGGACGVPA